MTVAMVIHQPRYAIFTLFDRVLFLQPGGESVFLGEPQLAAPYFESIGFAPGPTENPADYCLDVISGCIERMGSEEKDLV